jgi:acyl carrier protein
VPQEYPDITCRRIDVSLPEVSWQAELLYENLIAELTATATEATIAYRGGRRWIQTFQPIAAPDGAPTVLRAGGVYLFTGGFGRIARTLARHLAQTVRAKLVLLSRQSLPPREQWATWRVPTPDDPIGERIRFIEELETLGAEVLPIAADVAEAGQMHAAIAQARSRFGALHGVLHTAAARTAEMLSISETTRGACEVEFRAKVKGTAVLAEVLADQPLDFCMLFSSLSARLGGLGFAAYAAANRFMDTFAQQRNQHQSTLWLSINWDGWQFDLPAGRTDSDELGIAPEEGVKIFREALRLGRISPVIVSTGDLTARLARWVNRQENPMQTIAARAADLHSRGDLQTPYTAPGNSLEQEIAAIWRQLLGVADIGMHDDFFDLGGHSLLATQLMSRIRKQFSVQLSVRSLYDTPTIAGMARVLEEGLFGDVDADDLQDVEALLAEEKVNRP